MPSGQTIWLQREFMNITDIVFWAVYFFSVYTAVFLLITFFEQERFRVNRLKRLPAVSIIVPAYNEESTIESTLQSLFTLDYPKKLLEIIVVNDGSKDNTESAVKGIISRGTPFKTILISQKNKGKGAALNSGIAKSSSEFIACLDADSIVRKDTLKKMISYFGDENVAVVTPIMKVYDPKTMIQKLQFLEYILFAFLKNIFTYLDSIHVAPGPFSIYRRKTILDLGGFDEESLVEDQEIGYRLQKYHYRILQCRAGEVLTIAPKTVKELYYQRCRWFKGSAMTLYKYRRMIFNKDYGDFGTFQLPTLVVGLLMPFVTIAIFLRYITVPIIEYINKVYLVGFSIDLSWWLSDMHLKLLFYDYSKLFVVAVALSVGLFWMVKSHKNANEKLSAINVLPLLLYFLAYYIILSFICVCSMFELLVLRKKGRWK